MIKVCVSCKIVKKGDDFHRNKSQPTGLHTQCKVCRRKHYDANADRIKAYSRSWNDKNRDRIAHHNLKRKMSVKGRARQLWHGAKSRTDVKGYDFDLTIEWIAERLSKGFCERTGIPFQYESVTQRTNPFAPSLDRVNNHYGYTKANVAVVCWAYNMGKNEMTHEQFVSFCKSVVDFNA